MPGTASHRQVSACTTPARGGVRKRSMKPTSALANGFELLKRVVWYDSILEQHERNGIRHCARVAQRRGLAAQETHVFGAMSDLIRVFSGYSASPTAAGASRSQQSRISGVHGTSRRCVKMPLESAGGRCSTTLRASQSMGMNQKSLPASTYSRTTY